MKANRVANSSRRTYREGGTNGQPKPLQLTPLVFLVLIILAMCGALGMILGMDPFGPGQDARATSAAINSQATGSALGATETPQAAFAGQTALAIQMTGVPPAQTATAIAFEETKLLFNRLQLKQQLPKAYT